MNAKRTTAEKIYKGLGVAPGIAIGTVHIRDSGSVAIPEYQITASKVKGEQKRLDKAVERAKRQIRRLKTKADGMSGAAAEEMGYLLDAYLQMLTNSRLVRGARDRIKSCLCNAEAALQTEINEIAQSFAELDDTYIAARLDDIREVADRLMRILTEAPTRTLNVVPKGSIIITEEMTPADAAQLDASRVTGFAAMLGGAQGHTAIMARALGLPAVLGAPGLMKGLASGDAVIVDGDAGRVIVNPTAKTLSVFETKQNLQKRDRQRLKRLRSQQAVTRDGKEITLHANVELPIEMPLVEMSGAQGVGLLRSEFMFMNREDIPSEEEQFQLIKGVVKAMDGKPVTIRTLDIGGEKVAESLVNEFGDSISSPLGLRGIRLSLANNDILESQLTAILRASAFGPVRILLPMVSTTVEVRRTRDVLARVVRRLRRKKIKIGTPLPPVGVMIEVPSAALSADALAQAADFFAIGSNDLTMFTLAIDRGDEQVANIYDPLHPAVLRLIQFSAEAALRSATPISICGEVAGDPRFTALLIGLGLSELSMTPSAIPAVKQRIRELDYLAAERRARVIMDQVDAGRIAMLLDDFNALA